jgi:hypothetical protein
VSRPGSWSVCANTDHVGQLRSTTDAQTRQLSKQLAEQWLDCLLKGFASA